MGVRERLFDEGADRLGDAELIAVLFGTGVRGRPAPTLAGDVLAEHGGLGPLARRSPDELASVQGIGRARAARVLAAVELGRRALVWSSGDAPVTTARAAYERLWPGLAGRSEEELHALYLDRRLRPLGRRSLTRGSDAFTVVDARQIYRPAVALGAHGVVLAHNHPSGDPTPSVQDLEVTRRVARAGGVLGVTLVDHLVIGGGRYVSLAERGDLPAWNND